MKHVLPLASEPQWWESTLPGLGLTVLLIQLQWVLTMGLFTASRLTDTEDLFSTANEPGGASGQAA